MSRSKLMLGAATALALVTAGWLGAGAAVADETPTPDPTVAATDTPTDPTAAPTDEAVDPNGPALPSPSTTLPGLHKPANSATGLKLPQRPGPKPAITTHGNNFSDAVVPGATTPYDRYWPSVDFNSTSFSTQGGEPRTLQPGRVLAHTAWMKWVAPLSGYVSVAVSGGSGTDTGVNIYTGSSMTHLTRVAWNDDQYSPVDGASLSGSAELPVYTAVALTVPVVKGKTYYIQAGNSYAVGDPTPATGYADLAVTVYQNRYIPVNDAFTSAIPITFDQGSGAIKEFNALINGATMDLWEPIDNDSTPANERDGSVWYKLTAPQTGIAVIGTCGFLGGPSVEVFGSNNDNEGAGAGAGDLKALAFDDGTNGSGPCGSLSSGASTAWVMNQGDTYFLQLSHVKNTYPANIAQVKITGIFTEPYIDKLSKTSGHAGTTITITGYSLGSTPTVKFGSKVATIISHTPTTIVVKVPTVTKTTYQVTVTNSSNVSNKVPFKVN